jgi:hypothetical protein
MKQPPSRPKKDDGPPAAFAVFVAVRISPTETPNRRAIPKRAAEMRLLRSMPIDAQAGTRDGLLGEIGKIDEPGSRGRGHRDHAELASLVLEKPPRLNHKYWLPAQVIPSSNMWPAPISDDRLLRHPRLGG